MNTMIKFKISTDLFASSDYYKLRHQVYCEELEVLPKHPDNVEIDEFDSSLVSIMAYDNTKCVGGVRVIYSEDHGDRLPITNALRGVRETKNTVEISRMVIDKPYRKNIKVFSGLLCLSLMDIYNSTKASFLVVDTAIEPLTIPFGCKHLLVRLGLRELVYGYFDDKFNVYGAIYGENLIALSSTYGKVERLWNRIKGVSE